MEPNTLKSNNAIQYSKFRERHIVYKENINFRKLILFLRTKKNRLHNLHLKDAQIPEEYQKLLKFNNLKFSRRITLQNDTVLDGNINCNFIRKTHVLDTNCVTYIGGNGWTTNIDTYGVSLNINKIILEERENFLTKEKSYNLLNTFSKEILNLFSTIGNSKTCLIGQYNINDVTIKIDPSPILTATEYVYKWYFIINGYCFRVIFTKLIKNEKIEKQYLIIECYDENIPFEIFHNGSAMLCKYYKYQQKLFKEIIPNRQFPVDECIPIISHIQKEYLQNKIFQDYYSENATFYKNENLNNFLIFNGLQKLYKNITLKKTIDNVYVELPYNIKYFSDVNCYYTGDSGNKEYKLPIYSYDDNHLSDMSLDSDVDFQSISD